MLVQAEAFPEGGLNLLAEACSADGDVVPPQAWIDRRRHARPCRLHDVDEDELAAVGDDHGGSQAVPR